MQFKPYVQFELCPDRSVNNKKVHDLFRAISSFHASPLEVLRGHKVAGAFWWDIMIRHDEIRFFCTIPEPWKREVRMHIENTWPLASIEEVENHTALPAGSDVCEMKLRRHNIFAIQTDRRLEHEPLNSLLSIHSEMKPGDIARVSICASPMGRLDWQDYADRQHQEFKKGKTPKRTQLTKKDILVGAGEGITNVLQSLFNTFEEATGGKSAKLQDDYEKRMLLLDGDLTKGTLNKKRLPTFHTHIRIAAYSLDKPRQQIIMRTLGNSFNDLTADNELERDDIHPKLKPYVLQELNSYQFAWPTKLDYDKNVFSNEELGRLVELPSAALQDLYKDQLSTLDTRQIEIPALLLKGGIPMGTVAFKKTLQEVFFPVKDHDQLCLPSCAIGPMGCGKTKGFAVNRALGFVKQGFSALIVDPKKSEVWEIIEKVLPKEKRRRILLGKDVISLDFREALKAPGGKARLAQILFAFFDTNSDDLGAQTQRFLRAAVMGMRTGRIAELVSIFRDKKYRIETINAMPKDSIHRLTLQEYHDNEGRQVQISAPIFNRLDMLLGDPYMEQCMNATVGLDMVEITSKRGMVTVIDIPDRLNTREAKNILINLISFKIDAAMSQRTDLFPYAVIYDEPHQYLNSASLWKSVCVEARAYRFAYHFLFHSWEHIPRDLAQIIKDAGVHFYLYPSSKQTYKGLLEEIAPFTVEDGLNTPRFHAICALKLGDKRMTPFMAYMSPPPA